MLRDDAKEVIIITNFKHTPVYEQNTMMKSIQNSAATKSSATSRIAAAQSPLVLESPPPNALASHTLSRHHHFFLHYS
eukprot:SAG31_NODE_30_length_32545_cov_9.378999_29_plen_78_part_00